MNFFGWLMSLCVSDDPSRSPGRSLSEAVLFASGMAAGGLTLYFAGLYHLI